MKAGPDGCIPVPVRQENEMCEIRTKDAEEAAFLWVQRDAELLGTEVRPGRYRDIVWFTFSLPLEKDDLDLLMTNYREGRTLVEPTAYSGKRLEIRHIIKEKVFGGGQRDAGN